MYSFEPEPPEVEYDDVWRPEEERRHMHYCLAHKGLYLCGCRWPEIEDFTCDRCDRLQADKLIAA